MAGGTAPAAERPLPNYLLPPDSFESYVKFEPFPTDEYRKVKTLAEAIHGKVFLYHHVASDKEVVVKRMLNTTILQQNSRSLELPLVEIGVSAYLAKQRSSLFRPKDAVPYCVTMDHVYQDRLYTYFVTEYCAAGELFNHVKERGRFDEERARIYTAQVLEGIEGLHNNGVVHRDISLENILLHADGTVRIIDYGQAIPVHSRTGGLETGHKGRASKAYYRAPEMYDRDGYAGPPIDVFALGVLLFIMAIGTPPWDNANTSDPRFRYIRDNGVGPLLNAWGMQNLLSPECVDLLTKLLRPAPDQRITIEEAKQHAWFHGMLQ